MMQFDKLWLVNVAGYCPNFSFNISQPSNNWLQCLRRFILLGVNGTMYPSIVKLTYIGAEFETECATFWPAYSVSKLLSLSFFILGAMNNIFRNVPLVLVVSAYRANILQPFHLLQFKYGEVGSMKLRVVERFVVARHHARIIHHQTGGHVHFTSNHCIT